MSEDDKQLAEILTQIKQRNIACSMFRCIDCGNEELYIHNNHVNFTCVECDGKLQKMDVIDE